MPPKEAAELAEEYLKRAKKRKEDIDKAPRIHHTLFEVAKFLQDHSTDVASDTTHVVWEQFDDWWCSQQMKARMSICEDNTVQRLYDHILTCYELGIPLTLAEKHSPEVRFFQDIEVITRKADAQPIPAEDLISADSPFMKLLGECMGEMYTLKVFDHDLEVDGLDVVAFDATGYDQVKFCKKTSIRLIWKDIIVNRDRCLQITDFLVDRFSKSKDEDIKQLGATFQQQGVNQDNDWRHVFGDKIYGGRAATNFGIRMPLCDKTSPAPMKKLENRPFKPLGLFRFRYGGDGVRKLQDVQQLISGTERIGSEWLGLGCVRQPMGTPLTTWDPPRVAPRERQHAGQGEQQWQPSDRSVGRARTVRTSTGSPSDYGGGGRRGGGQGGLGRPQPREELRPREVTAEREFTGTIEAFREEVVENTNLKGEGTVKIEKRGEQDILVWLQDRQGGASIEFKPSNHRVYIKGTAPQVKSLLAELAKYVQKVGGDDGSVTSYQRTNRGEGSRHETESLAPSAVYQPSNYGGSTMSTGSTASTYGDEASHRKRQVIMDFVAQQEGELALKKGETVVVTHDPEAKSNAAHRWSYGHNTDTGMKGWFPFNHTAVKDVPVVAEEVEEQQEDTRGPVPHVDYHKSGRDCDEEEEEGEMEGERGQPNGS